MAQTGAGAKVSKASRAAVGAVTGTVGGVVAGASGAVSGAARAAAPLTRAGAAGAVAPLTGAASRELARLEKQLAKARKLETKRFSQLAEAQRTKSSKGLDRRLHQASDAAADVAAIVAKMGVLVKHAAGSAVGAVEDTARGVGTAGVGAAEAFSPVKSTTTRSRARARSIGSTSRRATGVAAAAASTSAPVKRGRGRPK